MDSETIRIDIEETPDIWIENLVIDHIHPSWHPGKAPLEPSEFESARERERISHMLANAPIRLGGKK